MKKRFYSFFIAALALMLLCLSLSSCGKGIKGDDAKATVKDFFACVEKEDYEGALALMHPEKATTAEAIKILVKKDETDEGIDLSLGITDIKYNGFESSVYDSEVGGARYELSGHAKAGDVRFEFEIELIKTDEGYGIKEFDFD